MDNSVSHGEASPDKIDSQLLEIATICYAPTALLHTEHTVQFGQLVLDRSGLNVQSVPELAVALPIVARHVAECGVPESMIVKRAATYESLRLIQQGIQESLSCARIQAATLLEKASTNIPPNIRMLRTADQLAHTAYDGIIRRSGAPYYLHPKSVTAMTFHTLQQLQKQYEIPQVYIDAEITIGLLHDAGEETKYPVAAYRQNQPVAWYTPLVVRELCEQTGNPHGSDVANALRLLTHFPKQPWAPTYEEYIRGGIDNHFFVPVKFSDIAHNILDPKPIPVGQPDRADKIYRKRALYDWSITTILAEAPTAGNNLKDAPWMESYLAIIQSIRSSDLPELIFHLDSYLYGT